VLITLSITNFLKQGFKKLLSHVLLPFLLLNFTAPSAHAQPNTSVQFHIERIGQYQHPNNTGLRRVYVLQETRGYLQKLGQEIGVRSLAIVDDTGFLLVDPGPDARYTQALLSALKKVEPRLKSHPDVIINSVARPEHALGNSTITNQQTQIYATLVTQANMIERCPNCRKRLSESLNNAELAKTAIQTPNAVLNLSAGIPDYPEWQLFEFQARTESDLVLWHPQLKILFAGGLISHQSIPDLIDGWVLKWQAALKELQQLQPKVIVGTGPYLRNIKINQSKTTVEQLKLTDQYLNDLEIIVRKDFLAGGNEADADKCLNLEQLAKVKGYKKLHPLNIQRVWREIETQEMNKSSISPN
jgi:glyoxylase-like metal-dependent hydrolase (beta-lactamase superfamily II)